MLLPKKTKFRKYQRGRRRGMTKGQDRVQFGDFGLKATGVAWLTNREIEAARIAMTRKIKRGGKVWINVFPDKPVTKKPAETRMGKGKGSPEAWVAVVKPGRVMFELAGVPEPLAKEALRLAGNKLSVKSKIVKREADLFESYRPPRSERRPAGGGVARSPPGAVQSALPVSDRRAREHRAAEAREARDRPHPDRPQPKGRNELMSDIENDKNTTEPGETVETDVETAQQPEGSQPTEVPAAEPETVEEGAPAEPEAAVEPEAAAEPEPEPEAPAEPVAEAPAAEPPGAEAPAPPPAEPARKRSLKHVPRSARRTRTKRQRERPATRKPIVRLEKPQQERGRRQERRGVVVSDAMDKTIVVKVESVRAHQRYKKVIRRSTKFHAHDEQNQAHVGDLVRIVETRPLSKTKNWRLAEILEAAK